MDRARVKRFVVIPSRLFRSRTFEIAMGMAARVKRGPVAVRLSSRVTIRHSVVESAPLPLPFDRKPAQQRLQLHGRGLVPVGSPRPGPWRAGLASGGGRQLLDPAKLTLGSQAASSPTCASPGRLAPASWI